MPRDFYFSPPTCSLRTLGELRADWINIKDVKVRNVVAVEAQYIEFHRFVLKNVRHVEQGATLASGMPLGMSVRAGALKALMLMSAAVCEAVLRYHAERRGYSLPNQAKHRTYGKVLDAWKDASGSPHPEVAAVWPVLTSLRKHRNNVHLFSAAADSQAEFEYINKAELKILKGIDDTFPSLQALTSP
jgi:hypothetical protein